MVHTVLQISQSLTLIFFYFYYFDMRMKFDRSTFNMSTTSAVQFVWFRYGTRLVMNQMFCVVLPRIWDMFIFTCKHFYWGGARLEIICYWVSLIGEVPRPYRRWQIINCSQVEFCSCGEKRAKGESESRQSACKTLGVAVSIGYGIHLPSGDPYTCLVQTMYVTRVLRKVKEEIEREI